MHGCPVLAYLKQTKNLSNATLPVWVFPIHKARSKAQGDIRDMDGRNLAHKYLFGGQQKAVTCTPKLNCCISKSNLCIMFKYLKFEILRYSSEPALINTESSLIWETNEANCYVCPPNKFWWKRISVDILLFTIQVHGTKQMSLASMNKLNK